MKKKLLIFISILAIIFIIGLFSLWFMNRNKVAVLGYHNVYMNDYEYNGNDPFMLKFEHFEAQLQYLKKHKYKTLTLDEYYCFKQKTCKQPQKSVLITFDDGFYFNYKYAFPLLKKYNMNAALFVIGKNLENGQPDDHDAYSFLSKEYLEKVKAEYLNISVASHSYNLHGDIHIDMMDKDAIKNDFASMNEIINTKYFAYPFGIHNDLSKEVLKEENIRLAFGFGKDKQSKKAHRKSSINDDNYLIPRFNIYAKLPMWKFKLYLQLP